MLNPPVNGKIQELFKTFKTFQDSPVHSNTFQACANPGLSHALSWTGTKYVLEYKIYIHISVDYKRLMVF